MSCGHVPATCSLTCMDVMFLGTWNIVAPATNGIVAYMACQQTGVCRRWVGCQVGVRAVKFQVTGALRCAQALGAGKEAGIVPLRLPQCISECST